MSDRPKGAPTISGWRERGQRLAAVNVARRDVHDAQRQAIARSELSFRVEDQPGGVDFIARLEGHARQAMDRFRERGA